MTNPPTSPVDRLLLAYNCDRDARLVERLKVAKSTVSSWRAKGRIPAAVAAMAHIATGASVAWLQTGEGEPGITLDSDVAGVVTSRSVLRRAPPVRRAPIAQTDTAPAPVTAQPAPVTIDGAWANVLAHLNALSIPDDTAVRITIAALAA